MLVERDDGARYLMLDTIREYAREKLAQRDDAAAVAARHCDHYFALAKAARDGLRGPEQADWLWRLEVELDNIRSAIALSLAGARRPVHRRSSSRSRCRASGSCAATRAKAASSCSAALALPAIQASPVAQAWALYVGAALAESQSDHAEARKMLETCLELRRDWATRSTSPPRCRRFRWRGSRPATPSRRRRARARRCRSSGASATASAKRSASCISARSACTRATTRRPASHLEHGLAIAREIRHQEVEGECELVLGEVALETGDAAQACLRFKRSLTVCREAGDKRGEANALRWLARVDLRSGDFASARLRLSDALRAFRAFEMREELLGCLEDHAELAEAEGKREVAVGLAAAAAQVTRAARPDPLAARRAALAGARRRLAPRDDRSAVRQRLGRRRSVGRSTKRSARRCRRRRARTA